MLAPQEVSSPYFEFPIMGIDNHSIFTVVVHIYILAEVPSKAGQMVFRFLDFWCRMAISYANSGNSY